MSETRYFKGKYKVEVIIKTPKGVRGDWRVVALEEFYYVNPYTPTGYIKFGMIFGCTPNLLWRNRKKGGMV